MLCFATAGVNSGSYSPEPKRRSKFVILLSSHNEQKWQQNSARGRLSPYSGQHAGGNCINHTGQLTTHL